MNARRILVVEDEAALQRLVTRMLDLDGFVVVVAGNGIEALRAVAASSFDLVITDIVMPEMEGLGLIRALRAMALPPKLIAMSGGARKSASSYLNIAGLLGADATLTKPFSHAELSAAIARVFGDAIPA